MAKSSRKLWAEHLAGRSSKSTEIDPKMLLKKVPYRGRILGIDPSLRGTGLAVLECRENQYSLLHSETLSLKPKIDSIACLGMIHNAVSSLVDLWQPRHVSCEATIYVQNFKTAQIMGAARGAALSHLLLRRFLFLNMLLYELNRLLVLVGRAKSKCRRLYHRC